MKRLMQIGCCVLVAASLMGAKAHKPKPESPPPDTQTPPAAPATPTGSDSPLPADLNDANLRVEALDTFYELDLSAKQLELIRTSATGAASRATRTPAKADAKVATAISSLNDALLAGIDDKKIADLRNELAELLSDDSVHLDDEIHPTDTAWSNAQGVVNQLSASQLAAYLAAHADQVADPVDRMVSAITDLAENNEPDVPGYIAEVSEEVGHLVAGTDPAKSSAIAAKVATWIRFNRNLKEDEIAAKKESLETSAKSAIGEVTAVDVLNHWVQMRIAELLSNPQAVPAAEKMLAAKQKAQ